MVSALDSRLQADCLTLGRLYGCRLLLMNNALVPWFILVPDTDKTELFELPKAQWAALRDAINALSALLKTRLDAHKINVAAIGNVVKQLHVHVVGRRRDDFCWPGVVWSTTQGRPYDATETAEIATLLRETLAESFEPEVPVP